MWEKVEDSGCCLGSRNYFKYAGNDGCLLYTSCSYQNESMIIFLRKSRKSEETLLFICNFDNMEHEKFQMCIRDRP